LCEQVALVLDEADGSRIERRDRSSGDLLGVGGRHDPERMGAIGPEKLRQLPETCNPQSVTTIEFH
jgi:hypothetical protein